MKIALIGYVTNISRHPSSTLDGNVKFENQDDFIEASEFVHGEGWGTDAYKPPQSIHFHAPKGKFKLEDKVQITIEHLYK